MTFNNLPLYELTLNLAEGVKFISIVDKPAIKSNFLCFSEEQPHKFSIQDPDKRLVSGLAMIPNLPIYRKLPTGEEFYVQFSADTIRKLVEKFFNEQRTLAVNVEHELPVSDVVIIESYFIDKERGIAPVEFPDVENGAWYVTMKVNNDELWNEIKVGNLNGFSVEGLFDFSQMFTNNEQPELPELPPIDELKEPTYKSVYDIIADTIFK